jgi:hypothetical protein
MDTKDIPLGDHEIFGQAVRADEWHQIATKLLSEIKNYLVKDYSAADAVVYPDKEDDSAAVLSRYTAVQFRLSVNLQMGNDDPAYLRVFVLGKIEEDAKALKTEFKILNNIGLNQVDTYLLNRRTEFVLKLFTEVITNERQVVVNGRPRTSSDVLGLLKRQ